MPVPRSGRPRKCQSETHGANGAGRRSIRIRVGGLQRQQVVDAGRGMPRHVHAAARRHHRQRGPAGHPAGPEVRLRRPPVGRRRLRVDPGRAAAGRGQPGRSVRPPAAVPGRTLHLHRRLAAVRIGHLDAHAAVVPCAAGHRRRRHVRRLTGPAGRRVPRQGSWYGLRHLGRGDRAGGRDRPAARRGADLGGVLALDLLCQRTHRPDRGDDHDRARGRIEGQRRPASRCSRLRRLHARPRRHRLRPDRVEPALLHGSTRAGVADRRRCTAGRIRVHRTCGGASDVRARPVRPSDVQRWPVAAFGISASIFSCLLYLVLYLQDVLGFSAYGTGLRLFVLSAGSSSPLRSRVACPRACRCGT